MPPLVLVVALADALLLVPAGYLPAHVLREKSYWMRASCMEADRSPARRN